MFIACGFLLWGLPRCGKTDSGFGCLVPRQPRSLSLVHRGCDQHGEMEVVGRADPQIVCDPARVKNEGSNRHGTRTLSLGRSAVARYAIDGRGENDPRCRARLCARPARAARARSISARAHGSGHFQGNGRRGPSRRHHPRNLRRRRTELCQLRAHRARSGAHRFRLPLDDERAIVVGDVADF